MTPTIPRGAGGAGTFQEIARRPLDSDGVGGALRQIFARQSAVPTDLTVLLGRLDDRDQ